MKKEKIISKYKVDPDDRITVKVWIDHGEDNGFRVLSSNCVFTQGKSPCMGSPLEPCRKKYEFCNNHTKDLCTDELGKLKFVLKRDEKDVESLKHIRPEWAKFARETWAIRSYIESHSYKFDQDTQTRVFDSHRQQILTIRCLLKEWSLGTYDSELSIQHCEVPGMPFTMVQEDQMKRIFQIDGELMRAFIDGYYKISRDI